MSDPNLELTKEEKAAISSLKRLAKRWPESLWLYNNGTMYVLKAGENGEHVHRGDAIDQDYVIEQIDGIHSDGGDW